MEDLKKLFDSCDPTYLGKVAVSKLILAVTNEINTFNNNDHQQNEKEEILMTVRNLLDPSDQDIQVDKATWLAAWRKQAETPSPKKSQIYTTTDLAGGDDFGIGNTSGPLDMSKNSFCFSPVSHSSSQEESDELLLIKEENQQLQSSLKTVKQKCQELDKALLQEQIEKQELEKSKQELEKLKDSEVNKLNKQIKSLIDSTEELKCSLDACEREKLELCHSFDSLLKTEKQLKLELTEQDRVITDLNSEICVLSQERENSKIQIKELQTKLEHLENIHQERVIEYQKTIQSCQDEKDELRCQITNSMLEKSKLSACWDELDCSSSSNLQSELGPFNFQSNNFLPDSPTSLQKSLLLEMQAVKIDVETQTRTPPKRIDKCHQAEAKLCPVETQTSPLAFEINDGPSDMAEDFSHKPPSTGATDIFNKPSNLTLGLLNQLANVSLMMNCHADTQTSGDFNITAQVPPIEVKKCNQAEVQMFPVELQTQVSPFAFEINEKPNAMSDLTEQINKKPPLTRGADIFNKPSNLTLGLMNQQTNVSLMMNCHADTQTSGDFNNTAQIPLIEVKKCNQAEVQMCPVKLQTQASVFAFEINEKPNQMSDTTEQINKKPPLTGGTDIFHKPSNLTLELLNQQTNVSLIMNCHADTQTSGDFNNTAQIPPIEVKKCNQAEVQMYPVKLQTQESLFAFEINEIPNQMSDTTEQINKKPPLTGGTDIFLKPSNLTLGLLNQQTNVSLMMNCHADTQTLGDLDVTVQVPPTEVNKCHRAEFQMCPVETETSFSTFEINEKPNLISDMTEQFYTKPPSTGATDIFSKPSHLTLGLLNQDTNVSHMMTCHVETQTLEDSDLSVQLPPTGVEKSIQVKVKMCPVETQTSPLTFGNHHNLRWAKFSCLFVALACIIFFSLLIISTIFCTGAILQIASDSGVLSFPYLGQTPEFVKSVMKPFVKVNVHRPGHIHVPI